MNQVKGHETEGIDVLLAQLTRSFGDLFNVTEIRFEWTEVPNQRENLRGLRLSVFYPFENLLELRACLLAEIKLVDLVSKKVFLFLLFCKFLTEFNF